MATGRRRPHPHPALKVNESPFQGQVIELAELLGWKWNHTYRCPRTERTPNFTPNTRKGMPDLSLWHPVQRRFLQVELKGDGGSPSPEQREVLQELRDAGVEAYLWWPRDLDRTIPTILRRRPRP